MGAHPQEGEALVGDAHHHHTAHFAKPSEKVPCPRCHSVDTKFCYFNNYNVKQPRHFCRSCLRYWTAGGSLRNVPVGSGRRRNRAFSPNGSSPTTETDVYSMPTHRSSFPHPVPTDGSTCKPTSSFPCSPQAEAAPSFSNESMASFFMAEGSLPVDPRLAQHCRMPAKSSAQLSHLPQNSSPQMPPRSSAEDCPGHQDSLTHIPTEGRSPEQLSHGCAVHQDSSAQQPSEITHKQNIKEDDQKEAGKVPPAPLVPVTFGSPQTMAVPWLWPWPCFSWPANYISCPPSSSSSSSTSCSLTFPQPPPSSSSSSPAPLLPAMFAAPISSLMPTMFAHPMASSSSPSPPLLPTIFPASPIWSPFLLGKRPSDPNPQEQPPAGTSNKTMRMDGLHPQTISSPSSSSSTTTFHEPLQQTEGTMPAPKPSQELVEGHIKAEPSAMS